MSEIKKPKAATSLAEQEIEKAEKQFEEFDANVKNLTLDRMNESPKKEVEQQTKIAQKDIEKCDDLYLKPTTAVGSRERFNERFREDYNFQKEYVRFIAENREIIGEVIEMWTKPFPGLPAEFWKVPVNKPVYGPRYLAEQIKRARYHRLIMQESKMVGADNRAQYYGQMAVDTTVQRLDALPVSSNKSIFMSAGNF